MGNKLSAIKAILKSSHYIVITPSSQVSCTPKAVNSEYWDMFQLLFIKTKREALERQGREDE